MSLLAAMTLDSDLLGNILAALGFEVTISDGFGGHGLKKVVMFFNIGDVLRCASVCQTWHDAAQSSVKGLVVPPVLLKHVPKPRHLGYAQRDNALKFITNHRRATTQALAWCLHRFPVLETLTCVGSSKNDAGIDHQLYCQFGPTMQWSDVHSIDLVAPAGAILDDHLAGVLGRHCHQLESLRGCEMDCFFSDSALNFLIQQCPNIQALSLPKNELCKYPMKRRPWEFLRNLRALDVTDVMTFNDISLTFVSEHCKHVQELLIGHTGVSGKGVEFLARGNLPDLAVLNLGGIGLEEQGVCELAASKIGDQLCGLAINMIDSSGLRALGEKCICLKHFCIEDDWPYKSHTTKDLIEFVEGLSGRLQTLILGRTDAFGDDVAVALGRCCPNLRVFRTDDIGLSFTDEGLRAMLLGCTQLRSLVISRCVGLSLYTSTPAPPSANSSVPTYVRFANLLCNESKVLRHVDVMGCSFDALEVLRNECPEILFECLTVSESLHECPTFHPYYNRLSAS